MSQRVMVIGDVHGCSRELDDLLQELDPEADDRLVFVGDLLNRGPDSKGVLERVRSLANCKALRGNHEVRLLRYRESGDPLLLKEYDWTTLSSLDDEDWHMLESMPLTEDLPEWSTVIVHGGFLPGQPWHAQKEDVVTRIQVVDPGGYAWKRSECPLGVSWADLWKGPPFVLYGHTPRPRVFRREWSLGLDTGCVYGGHLTACILPSRDLVQVPAHRKYVE